MKVQSYAFKEKKLTFVLVDAARGLDAVPAALKAKHGGLTLFKEFDLQASDKRIALNEKAALADIAKQGYHIQQAQITTTVK